MTIIQVTTPKKLPIMRKDCYLRDGEVEREENCPSHCGGGGNLKANDFPGGVKQSASATLTILLIVLIVLGGVIMLINS